VVYIEHVGGMQMFALKFILNAAVLQYFIRPIMLRKNVSYGIKITLHRKEPAIHSSPDPRLF